MFRLKIYYLTYLCHRQQRSKNYLFKTDKNLEKEFFILKSISKILLAETRKINQKPNDIQIRHDRKISPERFEIEF